MKEKQIRGGLLPEIPANYEKVQNFKLDILDPKDLIPPDFFVDLPIVKGDIRVVASKSDGHVAYVVTDEGQMSLHQIEDDFTYFNKVRLEEFSELEVEKNKYARPLVYGSLSEISPDILFVGMFETNPKLRGKGAGVAFQEHLVELAKKLNYKFLAGYQNDAKTARFFLKRGRYLLEEIKDELQKEFQVLREQEEDSGVFYTIKFLDPEDITKYIRPERINTDVEDKIEFKQKILILEDIFFNFAETLKKIEAGENEVGDSATLIEIVEDLNQILPEEEQYDLGELSEDDDNLVPILGTLLEHLKSKSNFIVRGSTVEQLEENVF